MYCWTDGLRFSSNQQQLASQANNLWLFSIMSFSGLFLFFLWLRLEPLLPRRLDATAEVAVRQQPDTKSQALRQLPQGETLGAEKRPPKSPDSIPPPINMEPDRGSSRLLSGSMLIDRRVSGYLLFLVRNRQGMRIGMTPRTTFLSMPHGFLDSRIPKRFIPILILY